MESTALKFIACNAISIVATICAGMLAWKGASGWGWFLLLAALMSHTIRTSED